ncbi:MAG: hypothetical protein RR313_00195 [Anaerovoracaceae bacterium]
MFFNKHKNKNTLEDVEFDYVFYFKTVKVKEGIFRFYYMIFYDDYRFIQPTVSPNMFKRLILNKTGMVGYKCTMTQYGTKNTTTLGTYNRAHRFPVGREYSLEELIEMGCAIQYEPPRAPEKQRPLKM